MPDSLKTNYYKHLNYKRSTSLNVMNSMNDDNAIEPDDIGYLHHSATS